MIYSTELRAISELSQAELIYAYSAQQKTCGVLALNKVRWTILIYASGNNELEPEIWQGMLNAEKVGSNADVNVIMQLSRAEYRLVRLIRKDIGGLNAADSWSGVRRYLIGKENSKLVGNIEKANMADPKTLYDFIHWGILTYPSERYMLILSGHGYQFVGMLTDYSRKAPYIMGIPEMVRAINKAVTDVGEKIDILLLDTCYSNTIESVYELGNQENHAVQNVIMYIQSGAIEGLPYNKVIQSVQSNCCNNDLLITIKEIIDSLPYDLAAFEVNYQKLLQIKQLYNDMAFKALYNDLDGDLTDQKVMEEINNIYRAIYPSMMSLVIHFKRTSQTKTPLLTVANKTIRSPEITARYGRLSFAQDNYWEGLLCNNRTAAITNTVKDNTLLPLKMRIEEVYDYIEVMNPWLEEKQTEELLSKLYRYKKWS